MRFILFIFFYALPSLCLAQENNFNIIDLAGQIPGKQCMVTKYIEKINDSITNVVGIYVPYSWRGDTMRETHILFTLNHDKISNSKILFDSCNKKMDLIKVGYKYLYAGIDYDYRYDRFHYAFTSYVFDSTFNLIKDTAIIIDDEGRYFHYDDSRCKCTSNSVFLSKQDSLFLFTSVTSGTNDIKLFSVKYNKNLDVVFKKEGHWEPENIIPIPLEEVTLWPGNDTIFLYSGRYRIALDSDFNELSWDDIVSGKKKKYSISSFQKYQQLSDSIIVFGESDLMVQNQVYEQVLLIGKYGSDWKFNFNDSVHLEYYPTYEYPSEIVFLPKNGLVRLDNGNYIGILSYFNSIFGDTTSSRIAIVKFSPDLRVLCQKTYFFPHLKIRPTYVDPHIDHGKIYLSGAYQVVNSAVDISVSELCIFYFDTLCNLPGAIPIEEYPGLNTKESRANIYGLTIYPNPAGNELHFYQSAPQQLAKAEIRVYNLLGQEIRSQTWSPDSSYIGIRDLASGIYICTISTAQGIVFAKSFVKQ